MKKKKKKKIVISSKIVCEYSIALLVNKNLSVLVA